MLENHSLWLAFQFWLRVLDSNLSAHVHCNRRILDGSRTISGFNYDAVEERAEVMHRFKAGEAEQHYMFSMTG